jgi:hypothetical protein
MSSRDVCIIYVLEKNIQYYGKSPHFEKQLIRLVMEYSSDNLKEEINIGTNVGNVGGAMPIIPTREFTPRCIMCYCLSVAFIFMFLLAILPTIV